MFDQKFHFQHFCISTNANGTAFSKDGIYPHFKFKPNFFEWRAIQNSVEMSVPQVWGKSNFNNPIKNKQMNKQETNKKQQTNKWTRSKQTCWILCRGTGNKSGTLSKTHQAKSLVRFNECLNSVPSRRAILWICFCLWASSGIRKVPDTTKAICAWSYSHWKTNNGPGKKNNTVIVMRKSNSSLWGALFIHQSLLLTKGCG